MAELLCCPEQFPIPEQICLSSGAAVAEDTPPLVAEGPLPVEPHPRIANEVLAQAENPTSVAMATIRRHYPREEPHALAGMRGSVRGAPSNGNSYRDWPGNLFIAVAERELMLPRSLTKRLVNHARPQDVTEGYAADWTVEQLREPAQKIADRNNDLMKFPGLKVLTSISSCGVLAVERRDAAPAADVSPAARMSGSASPPVRATTVSAGGSRRRPMRRTSRSE